MTDEPETPRHEPERLIAQRRRTDDRTIASTCEIHGARGFCNLRVTKVGGGIVLDPHVAGSCVIAVDESGTVALRDLLVEWVRTSP